MRSIKSIIGKGDLFILSAIIATHLLFFFLIRDHGMMMDEHYHYRQIVRFIGGDFTPDPELPMIPGYHYVISGIGKIFNLLEHSYYGAVSYFRFISLIISLGIIPVFYLVARIKDEKSAIIRTLQFSFFPLVSPFFFLIYTDLPSLLLMLGAFYLMLKKRMFWGVILASFNIYLRQNNIIWLMFFYVYFYVRENGYKWDTEKVKRYVISKYYFLLGPMLFAIYMLMNKRLSMGKVTHVNFTLVHPSNIYLILFTLFILFWPVILGRSGEILQMIRRNFKYAIVPAVLFPFFALTFSNTHPFNQGPFFIHNFAAVYFTQDLVHKLLLYTMVFLAVVFLLVGRLLKREDYILYPAALLFLLPLWFIEQRYYIVPFTFYILFRKKEESIIEYSLVLFFLAASVFIYLGIFNWKFFP